ncbi:phage integrase family protein [Mesorhizobium sp. B2-5-13]|uniref:site-specific integrase n=1 Tax=unclassified Mesorhizobium TaxID=325217 RepID=UPI001127CC66|nr:MULTISPECIES: site-specific integrase [unclassified Mesorhizobium]TPJ43457.1 phage integrase family protein [Mesorhizobium sp. B2-6-5]TPJ93362.1 phage integrase family protein [Mesorhizobium sp. B2-5-13]TPK47553.1 phage integrase family protein [Mesorhizobium sp. B2-5-5]
MKAVARNTRQGFPSQGIIVDLAGHPVDATGWKWPLNAVGGKITLNWKKLRIKSGDILSATAFYMARLVKSKSPDLVSSTFSALCFLSRAPAVTKAVSEGGEIQASFFSELRPHFCDSEWRLHFVRHWYCSCAELGFDPFSMEAALELDRKVVGGNRKGHAVLSLDPEQGPLTDLEITALLSGLNAANAHGCLSLQERAALWLCVAFGCNPLQMALLREEDLKVVEADGVRFVQLRVPRIKKRHGSPRAEFRERKLTSEIGDIVLELVAENRRGRELGGWLGERHAFPLFVRRRPRSDAGGPLCEYAMHMYSAEISDLVAAADKLGVVSPRTGKPLKIGVRRLRYTFATRLVREGASRREVAEALDHTDLQNVQVYFDIKSDIVESLDKSMALSLGRVAQAFMGKLVASENEADRGADPTSLIVIQDRLSGDSDGVGNCGNYSFCGLLAPIACYTCCDFQPWMDGPHHCLLDDLLRDRERKSKSGQDGRMVTLHDRTILAVADVIARIEDARKGAPA